MKHHDKHSWHYDPWWDDPWCTDRPAKRKKPKHTGGSGCGGTVVMLLLIVGGIRSCFGSSGSAVVSPSASPTPIESETPPSGAVVVSPFSGHHATSVAPAPERGDEPDPARSLEVLARVALPELVVPENTSDEPGTVTIAMAFAVTKATGAPWDDAAFGGPDPYVIVDGVSYRDSRCHDRDECAIVVRAGQGPLRIAVIDADAVFDDPVGEVTCGRGQVCDLPAARIAVSP